MDDGRTCPFGSPGLRSKASWTYYFSVPFDFTFEKCLCQFRVFMMMSTVSSFIYLFFFLFFSADVSEVPGKIKATAASLQPIALHTLAHRAVTAPSSPRSDAITHPVRKSKISFHLIKKLLCHGLSVLHCHSINSTKE